MTFTFHLGPTIYVLRILENKIDRFLISYFSLHLTHVLDNIVVGLCVSFMFNVVLYMCYVRCFTHGYFVFRHDIMLACWHSRPLRRPTFTDVKRRLEQMLERSTELRHHLTFNTAENKYYFMGASTAR